MDLRIKLPANWTQLKHLSVFYQDKIRRGVTLCLVIYLAYIFTQLLLNVFASNMQSQMTIMATVKSSAPNTGNMKSYGNLFGQFQRIQPRQDYKKVKLTPLNLTLVGIVFRAKNALAIIKDGNAKAKVYQQGDKITSSVLLKDIAKSYVVIERGGKLEKILIKFKYVRPNSRSNGKTIDLGKFKKETTPANQLSNTQKHKLGGYLKDISSKPESLLRLINIMPNFISGKLIGFKLTSSKEKQLFKDLGFKEGDMVTRINDTMLDNFSASLKVVKLLKQTRNFDIYLDRRGEQHIITVNLD